MRPEALYPLFAPVASLKGVGPKLAPLVEKAAGPQVRDVLFLKPTGAIRRTVTTVADAVEGEVQTFVVTVDAHQPGSGRTPYRIRVADETGFLHLVWFGAVGGARLREAHPVGAVRAVSGKVEAFGSERQIAHPDYLLPPERASEIPAVEPVYPATAGLPSRTLARLTQDALTRAPELAEWQDGAWLAARGWPMTSSWRTSWPWRCGSVLGARSPAR